MTAAAFASENSIISADGVAVVVGGSRGVGLACALRLGRSGATVHIVGRDAGALESAVVVGASEGLRFVPHVCDLSSLDDVERWLATAEEAGFDRAGVVVFAAAAVSSRPFVATDAEEMLWLFTVNVVAPQSIAARLLPGMSSRSSGRFVFIGSLSSVMGHPYSTAYAASKHGMVGLMRGLAAELNGTGVTANAVCPGYIDTDMSAGLVRSIVEKSGSDADAVRAKLVKATALGRLLDPDEVADAVCFFAGAGAGAINGQLLVVDGGGVQH